VLLTLALGACSTTRTRFALPDAKLLKDCPVELTDDPTKDIPALVLALSNCNADKAGLRAWADDLR
jgi:hypothetical protein